MIPTKIKLNDNCSSLSDRNNSRIMDDFANDLEAGIPFQPPRQLNKKMKKRKQLDALLKFRLSKSKRLSHDILRSSEDELFLPDQKYPSSKSQPKRYRRWCSYTRHIISFCLVCIFMIVCVGLAYANIELKTEVQNLSSRVTEIEKRFSNFEINRVLSTIEQLKTRLNLIERWNTSYIYERLQKLQVDFNHIKKNPPATETSMNEEDVDVSSRLNTIEQKSIELSDVADELEKLNHDADDQTTKMINEKTKTIDKSVIAQLLEQEQKLNIQQDTSQITKNILSLNESLHTNIAKWQDEIQSVRNQFENLNQSLKIQEFTIHFQELSNLVHNSSNKTFETLSALQSDLANLRSKIELCKCSKESTYLKPSVVDSNQLKQSIITKPNTPETTSTSPQVSDKTDHNNNTIDVAQMVNQPSSIPQ